MPMKTAFSINMCNRCMTPRGDFASQFCIAKMVKKKIRGKLSGHFFDFMKFSFGLHDISFGLYSSLFGFGRTAVGLKRMIQGDGYANAHPSKCSKFPISRFFIFWTLFSVFLSFVSFCKFCKFCNDVQKLPKLLPSLIINELSFLHIFCTSLQKLRKLRKLFFTFSFSFLKMSYMSTPASFVQPIPRHFPSLHLRCRMKLLDSNGCHSFIWTVALSKKLNALGFGIMLYAERHKCSYISFTLAHRR